MSRILFIHQNFPGQFVHVARALVGAGHEVHALGLRQGACPIAGVRYRCYPVQHLESRSSLELLHDMEVKLRRATACASAMLELKRSGLEPDVVVAHPGWGEALFVKDIWPRVRLVIFAEFYYSDGVDVGFDPEFDHHDLSFRQQLRLKNTVHLHALTAADVCYAPTRWQRGQLPLEFQAKTVVIHDGIDTSVVKPDQAATVELQRDQVRLKRGDEIVTFVNRNLEPYRGFHVFMRALPGILSRHPRARCLLVGGDGVSYGAVPAQGGSWRQVMLRELGSALPLDRVHFVGRLKYADYLRVLQVSACHVYLSYPFVLSWSCLEAMAAECTLVASRTAPVQEVVDDGENGLLVDFFDRQALIDRVSQVLTDPEANHALAHRARRRVVEDYDLKTVCLPRQLDLILGKM